jgi:hypothetical protein
MHIIRKMGSNSRIRPPIISTVVFEAPIAPSPITINFDCQQLDYTDRIDTTHGQKSHTLSQMRVFEVDLLPDSRYLDDTNEFEKQDEIPGDISS